MSLSETFDNYIELEEAAMATYIAKHNSFLKKIEDIESYFDGANVPGQVELAKMEYWYAKAQLYAYLISGYYRKQQKYYEALAEQEQANFYEKVRSQEYDAKLQTSTDAQYLSRRAKGAKLLEASKHEGNYSRWNGIAKSYENAINSIKDMIKGCRAEEKGGAY